MKFRTETQTVEGWQISFRNNVQMYCHRLTASKGVTKIDVPCEDTPEGHIGIWVADLDIESTIKDALIPALTAFFAGLGSAYKIYDGDREIAG